MFFLDSEHVGMREMSLPPPPPPQKKIQFLLSKGGGQEGGKEASKFKGENPFPPKCVPQMALFALLESVVKLLLIGCQS